MAGKPRGKPFEANNRANPGGRPKGFAARIQQLCGGKDYPKIADGYYLIALGTAKQRTEFFGEPVRVSVSDRIKALTELRDSGPGKPKQSTELSGPEGGPVPLTWLPPAVL